jgi:hypothetical protein
MSVQVGQKAEGTAKGMSALLPVTDIDHHRIDVRLVPILLQKSVETDRER